MKIKDVEKEVGISSHSIRFYEDAGLIHIKRTQGSKYRDFNEQDIKRLKEIKLFRSLDIPIEEIKRYDRKEITLEEMMQHQMMELKAKHQEMTSKEQLCEQISSQHLPLTTYCVNEYEFSLQQRKNLTPYESAGNMITKWCEEGYSKKRSLFVNIVSFIVWWPILYLIVYTCFQNGSLSMLITTFLTLFILILNSFYLILPYELYEFKEQGIYYIKREKEGKNKLWKIVRGKNIIDFYDFIAYDDIQICKIYYHVAGRIPINGQNVYQLDFYVYTIYDELIHLNPGILNVSDQQVRLTAEILREKAKKTMDPFHILEHLDLNEEDFYQYINTIHHKREHLRVFGNIKEIS